ncbi:MAG TPA: COX15/CtaA family protein, partial [Burkholderiaceae bacterium]|nr:COX15/CtaA family protein [Burkholderiaceae bacterium]
MIGFDFSPLLQMLAMAALLGGLPLAWAWRRGRGAPHRERLRLLTVLAMTLTFELILLGAFTRLTDSGLGCPDWPGCYGHASPLGAHGDIQQAQTAMPTGPVTHGKAWVEMLHRYFASGVGFVIFATALLHTFWRREEGMPSLLWSWLSLVWVSVLGAFGALTVTMKLFPAIVTLHLLLALGLLMLLGWQAQRLGDRVLLLGPGLRRGMVLVLSVVLVQVALGGWVSTNYAVLACNEFPTCQGGWWPAMDFARGFTLWRELGLHHDGSVLPFEALVAIHWTHRLFALAATVAVLLLAWRLHRAGLGLWARRLL